MSSASDVSSKLLAWIMAGSGTVLLYSAYKNRSPLDVLRDIEGPPAFSTASAGASGAMGFAAGSSTYSGNVGDIARLRMIANRELEPDLVSIRPSGKLDRAAAESLERIFAKLGYVIPNTSGWRSFQEQAAAFFGPDNTTLSDGSRRFADPKKSLHTVGLAIDLHSGYASRPEVVAAFAAEGWHRARPGSEPWHYSYGVRG